MEDGRREVKVCARCLCGVVMSKAGTGADARNAGEQWRQLNVNVTDDFSGFYLTHHAPHQSP